MQNYLSACSCKKITSLFLKREKKCNRKVWESYNVQCCKKLNYMIADCQQRLDLKSGTSRSLDLKTRCKSRHKQKSLREVLCWRCWARAEAASEWLHLGEEGGQNGQKLSVVTKVVWYCQFLGGRIRLYVVLSCCWQHFVVQNGKKSILSLSYEECQGSQIQINGDWKYGIGKWLVFVSAFFKVCIFTPLDNCPHVYGSPTFVEGAR